MTLRYSLFALSVLSAAASHGQRPGGTSGAGTPAVGRVLGRVIDGETRKGAEFTTIAIRMAANDSIVGGGISRSSGEFSIDKLPVGPPLKVAISFIGFKPYESQLRLTRDRPEQDLGNITLMPNTELLQEVEVTGERATMVMQVDRRVFNVEKDLSTQGGSGVDVMKNVPGLSVDLDGNVEMRGTRPQILIDGRPTAMTLEQLPAEEIERVEVITNPSVAFDANATGGIINVVLKRSTKPGYSGQVQAGIGTNGRYQGSANLNMKEGRWAFNLGYNFNTGTNVTDGSTERTERSAGSTTGYFIQDASSESARTMHGGRIGAEWQVTNRNLLTFSQSLRMHEMSNAEDLDARILGPGRELLSTAEQRNATRGETMSTNTQIGFRRRSAKEGREWTADLSYNTWRRSSRADFDQYAYDASGGLLSGSPRLQDNLGGSGYRQLNLQADFIEPLGDSDKLEYGIKGSWKLDDTYLDVFVSSPSIGQEVLDTSLTNDYGITDLINAAYVNWQHRLSDHWSMQAGFRFEQTWFETVIRNKDITFSYRYPDGMENLGKALFPALYLSRKWDGSLREAQFNVSRKISRPSFWQIMPFIMNADSRNVRIGNPALAPELSTLAEANHLLPFMKGKGSWLTSVFGRYTQDVITSYATPLPSDTTLLLNTFVNGSQSISGGWENIVKIEPLQGLQLTLSGTLQYTDVALGDAQGGLRNKGFNWNAKGLLAWRMRKDWSVQVNAEYEAPRIQPQGLSLAQYGVDLSLSHDITKRVSAVLNVNDVFFTRRWGNIIDTDRLYQESFRRREMRFVRFTLTWKFGEQNTSLFRRKQNQRPEPGSNGGGDMDM
ncbi:MAG: outer membrane beta-barrel protein [Flavobacteriales bacterium]|nr:MAG: outer membrane beta-barrel protein [Flavobacteriales bacterium]